MSFGINCLEITAKKWQWKLRRDLYKNLLSEEDYEGLEDDSPFQKRFFFNDFYEHNQEGVLEKSPNPFNSDLFFEKNINIQAIVGKNGSGKSTLMDLLYMLINNFACMFTDLVPRPNLYVRGLFVKLYFNINSLEYELKCNNSKTSLCLLNNPWGEIEHKIDLDNIVEVRDDLYNVAKEIFYTIVSNYAMLSFIPSNYKTACLELGRLQGPNLGGKWFANDVVDSWIQRIFHKNDGYTCPIVLNPMRTEGSVDVKKEIQLSKYRLLALLLYAKKNYYSFDDRYELSKIEVWLKPEFASNKLKEKWAKLGDINDEKIIEMVNRWLDDPNSISKIIIDEFKLKISKDSCNQKKIALAYLQDKILSLTKYSSYKNFSESQIDDLVIKNIDDVDKEKLIYLIRDISEDSSHAVTKIHQVVNFLSIKDDLVTPLVNPSGFKIFKYEDYENAIKISIEENKDEWNSLAETDYFHPPFIHIKPRDNDAIRDDREMSLDEIIECLPPSIFDYEIYLNDKKDHKEVSYSAMSSGELQLLQTISTHLYHVRNIMSVNGSRLQYKNINMIFDEVEICFHPEYQRLFVKKLVDIITNLKMNKDDYSFNIFLITHSPFVLSDIPPERVLYLKDGSMDVETKISSFAGNIGEMLYDSFFLRSTIGAFAEEKIKKAVEYRQKKNPDEEKEFQEQDKSSKQKEYEAIIKSIGDPVIRSLIEEVEVEDEETSSEEESREDV